MASRTQAILAIIGAVCSAGTAIVYLNFSARVMPSLGRLANPDGIAKMQAFNRTAVQPPFMLCFFGAALAGGYFIVRALRGHHARADLLAAAGGGLYLLGFILTVAYNVPLNDKLAAVDAQAASAIPVWRDYLSNWTNANSVRAVFSTLATALLIGATVAALRQDGSPRAQIPPTLTAPTP